VVAGVLHTVVLRAAAGLRAACTSLDDDAAAAMKAALDAANRGVSLVGTAAAGSSAPAWVEPWEQALVALAADDQVHGLVAGRVNRILLDSEQVRIQIVSARLSRQLSRGATPEHAAAWVDGLLEGEALLLLHEIELLRLLDEWVTSVAETTFEDLLPLLRRTFSRFQSPERRQIGGRVRNLDAADLHHTATLDLDLALPAAARVADLLQLEPA